MMRRKVGSRQSVVGSKQWAVRFLQTTSRVLISTFRLPLSAFRLLRPAACRLLTAYCLLTAMPLAGWSPCVAFPQPDFFFDTVSQQAIYVLQPGTTAKYRVALIPLIQFRGDPQEFGIVVPTPNVPTFEQIGARVFQDANFLTMPVWRSRSFGGGGCGFPLDVSDEDAGGVPTESGDGVTVISEQKIGAFDVAVLSATNPRALIEWLDAHGYKHGVQDDAVLEDYIAQKWVFTAMRVNGKGLNRANLFETEPLVLIYDADTLVYPLRLTALSASRSETTRLVLYTVGDKRMTFDGARTLYANQVMEEELDAIRLSYPAFGSLVSQGQFITKLQRNYSFLEMREDFVLEPTTSREYRDIQLGSFGGMNDWFWLGAVGVWSLRAARRRRR